MWPLNECGFGPPDGNWEGYVYYTSEDEENPAAAYRVGRAVEVKMNNGKRTIAYEEYDSTGKRLGSPVLQSYLWTHRPFTNPR